MSFRTVVIKNRSKLECKLGYLIVRGEAESKIHISEIETIIIESTGVACTAVLLCELIKNNVNVIFCNEKHLPLFRLIPFSDNFTASKNISNQCNWKEINKQKTWTLIIKNKISLQASLLKKVGLVDASNMLKEYILQLELNDSTNREGHAAKVYFNALFGNEFSRRNENQINAALNYGYSVVMASVSREIVAAGYITQLGIWHKNEFNHYNLASDLMEPFRIIVDDYVLSIKNIEDFKKELPALMLTKINVFNKEYFLEAAIRKYVRVAIKYIEGEISELPEIKEYVLGEYEL